MKILFLKLSLIFIILLPLTFLSKRWDNTIKVVVVLIAAIGAIFIDFIVDVVGEKLSIPKVEVKMGEVGSCHTCADPPILKLWWTGASVDKLKTPLEV